MISLMHFFLQRLKDRLDLVERVNANQADRIYRNEYNIRQQGNITQAAALVEELKERLTQASP